MIVCILKEIPIVDYGDIIHKDILLKVRSLEARIRKISFGFKELLRNG